MAVDLATSINLARNARVFVSSEPNPDPCAHNTENTFEVNILSDYSFSQDSNSETISLNEAGCSINRGSRTFNTDLAPVDISLTTYIRPYVDANGNNRAIEEFLLNGIISQYEEIFDTTVDDDNINGLRIPMQQRIAGADDKYVISNGIQGAGNNSERQVIDLSKSNVGELLKLNFYFKMDNVCYLVSDVQIESMEIAFDIEAIATMSFSGLGKAIEKVDIKLIDAWTGDINYVPVASSLAKNGDSLKPSEALYLNNKLSDVRLLSKSGDFAGTYYSLPITGGNISITNNISFLVPEELSVVSKPVFGSTGAREISGELTAYLRSEGTAGTKLEPMFSGDLLDHLARDVEAVSNEYALIISIAGCAARTPRLDLVIPHASLTVPTISTEDILSTSISFTAQGDTITTADEIEFHYLSAEGTSPETVLPASAAEVLGPLPIKVEYAGLGVQVTFDKAISLIGTPTGGETFCIQGNGIVSDLIAISATGSVVTITSSTGLSTDSLSYFGNNLIVDATNAKSFVQQFTHLIDGIDFNKAKIVKIATSTVKFVGPDIKNIVIKSGDHVDINLAGYFTGDKTYSATGLPSSLTINTKGHIVGSVTTAAAATTIKVTATGSDGTSTADSNEFTLTVT